MDTAINLIVLKEQPKKVHTGKLSDIQQEANSISKEYLLRKFPNLWPQLQDDFKNQKCNFINQTRKKFMERNIIDIEPKHLDITNFSNILQNAKHSPFCEQLYRDAWFNPQDDLKNKLKCLQQILRQDWVNSSDSEEDQFEYDIKKILQLSESDKKISNINSYLWLLNEERKTDSLLTAHYNNGVDRYLSVLKLAYTEFDSYDYAYVVFLHILRSTRNFTHEYESESSDTFIPLAAYNKDYHVIHAVIQNLFHLLRNIIKTDEINEIEDMRSTTQKRLSDILQGKSYQAEQIVVYQKDRDLSPTIQSVIKNIRKSFNEDESQRIVADNTQINDNEKEEQIENDEDSKGEEDDSNDSEGDDNNDDNDDNIAQKNDPEVAQHVKNDQDGEHDHDDNKRRVHVDTNVAIKGTQMWCKVCQKNISGRAFEMDLHERGGPHLRKLNELNLAATASCNNLDISDYISVDQKWKNAMTMSLSAFIEMFDPIPNVCEFLRWQNVLTQNDHEMIRSQLQSGDRVVQFVSIMWNKNNWFNYLKEALKEGGYNNLLDLLQRNYDSINDGTVEDDRTRVETKP